MDCGNERRAVRTRVDAEIDRLRDLLHDEIDDRELVARAVRAADAVDPDDAPRPVVDRFITDWRRSQINERFLISSIAMPNQGE